MMARLLKDKTIIEEFCKMNTGELQYYKGVIEGLLIKESIKNG